MILQRILVVVGGAMIAAFPCLSSIAVGDSTRKLAIGATVFTEEGVVVKGKYVGPGHQDGPLGSKTPLLSKSGINLTLEATIKERLKIVVEPEVQVWFNTYSERWMWGSLQTYRFKPNTTVLIQQGYGEYSFGNVENSPLRVAIGRFLYKYNSEARNLGEYLFRSGAYPGYLISDFDFPCARLTGVHLSSELFHSVLRQDLLFTREMDIEPLQDYSLSYVLGVNVQKILDIGAGVSFWRFLPAEDSMTTPRVLPYNQTGYLNSTTDTLLHTFSGTKLMGRLTLDVKPLFNAALFGKEDLKVYGEAAILGLDNYIITKDTTDSMGNTSVIPAGSYYDSLWQRLPVMFGINVPSPSLLFRPLSLIDNRVVRGIYSMVNYALTFDVISLQAEWYGCRFPNIYGYRKSDNVLSPVPRLENAGDYAPGVFDYHEDDWKWSVYAKKTLTDGFSLVGQIANDHLRNRADLEQYKDESEMLPDKNHWYWMVKAQFQF